MDSHRFDSLVRLLGSSRSRRTTLGVLLGAALTGIAAEGAAKGNGKGRGGKNENRGKGKNKKRNKRQQPAGAAEPTDGAGEMGAEAADCLNPGPSSNLNGCNFSGDDLDGFDLSSSSMKKTNFNGASLCGADLSSSNLREADFRSANLTRADLHSSGCVGIKTNPATRFCNTIMCNGAVNNSDCPGAAPGSVCCETANCADRACQTKACEDDHCAYENQPDGQAGNLCSGECCNGGCCSENQKCCGGECIAKTRCCTGNTKDTCPDNEHCCGGECIATTRCCTNGIPDACLLSAQRCCHGVCYDPALTCCFNDDCEGDRFCCRKPDTTGICKLGGCDTGDVCTVESPCDPIECASGPCWLCQNGTCCLNDDVRCESDSECCSGDCSLDLIVGQKTC